MEAGDIVKLKTNFEEELNKLGFVECMRFLYRQDSRMNR